MAYKNIPLFSGTWPLAFVHHLLDEPGLALCWGTGKIVMFESMGVTLRSIKTADSGSAAWLFDKTKTSAYT
jgi:hypothetical protein